MEQEKQGSIIPSFPSKENRAIINASDVQGFMNNSGASFMVLKRQKNGDIIPFSWGNREAVRRSLEDTEVKKDYKRQKKLFFIGSLLSDFIRKTFWEPFLKTF